MYTGHTSKTCHFPQWCINFGGSLTTVNESLPAWLLDACWPELHLSQAWWIAVNPQCSTSQQQITTFGCPTPKHQFEWRSCRLKTYKECGRSFIRKKSLLLWTDHILFTAILPPGQLVNMTLLSFSTLDQINADHLTQKIGFLSINWSFRLVPCLLLFMSHDTVSKVS